LENLGNSHLPHLENDEEFNQSKSIKRILKSHNRQPVDPKSIARIIEIGCFTITFSNIANLPSREEIKLVFHMVEHYDDVWLENY
jgi:hypothetical protein